MNLKSLFKKNNNIALASYPRSGNTWIRILLATLYFDHPQINSLIDLQKFLPDEHFKGVDSKQELRVNNEFKIIKTHSLNNRGNFKKAIYIYRNPIDVAWSYYNFLKDIKKLKHPGTEAFVESFLNGNIPFGSWEDNVKSWMCHDNKLVISYEDFAANPLLFVLKINEFLGVFFTKESIQKAINNVTPSIVKKITDDEIFYGSNKPAFVSTPLNNHLQEKKEFSSKYSSKIKAAIKVYDFDSKKLLTEVL